MYERILKRFESKFIKGSLNECREWEACCDKINGYPRFGDYWAHRFSYILYVGNIPKGLFVCHTCDNPKCVNPQHLFLGTHKANMADMVRKDRHNKGIRNPSAKLTPQDVKEIRDLYNSKLFTLQYIAKCYNSSESHVCGIGRNYYWRSI